MEVDVQQAAAQAHTDFLDTISKQVEAKHQQALQAACQKFEHKQAELRMRLEADHRKQIADLQGEHKAAEEAWEAMLARRGTDSQLFKYTVRGCEGPHLSGCVPRRIFEAEPDSALAHMYNGEWEYATDEQGRAVVNSNPAHWPIIIDWLSFGTVPTNPPAGLFSECRYWQLDRLLTVISPSVKPYAQYMNVVTTTVRNCRGFKAYTVIDRFAQLLDAAGSEKKHKSNDGDAIKIPFSAMGRDWSFDMTEGGSWLRMVSGREAMCGAMMLELGVSASNPKGICKEMEGGMKYSPGQRWGFGLRGEDLTHPGLLTCLGDLCISISVGFSK